MSLAPPDPTPDGQPVPTGPAPESTADRGATADRRPGAPAGRGDPPAAGAWSTPRAGTPRRGPTPARPAWIVLTVAVAVEFAAGLAALVFVPVGRPSGVFPHRGRVVFDAHAAFGVLIVAGAVALAAAGRRYTRMLRIASRVALAGVLVGAAGGVATIDHGLRVLGIGLMFLGSLVAGFAYLVGVLEPPPEEDAEQASAGAD